MWWIEHIFITLPLVRMKLIQEAESRTQEGLIPSFANLTHIGKFFVYVTMIIDTVIEHLLEN